MMNTESVRLANEWAREEARLAKAIKKMNKAIEALDGCNDPKVLEIKALISLEIGNLAEQKEDARKQMSKWLSKLYA